MTPLILYAARVGSLALGGVALVIWAIAIYELTRRRRGSFLEAHHAYWGALALLIPPMPGARLVVVLIAWLLGLVMLWDDAYQHTEQIFTPGYLSPLHRLYERVYRALVLRH